MSRVRRNNEEKLELLTQVRANIVASLKADGYWQEGDTPEVAIERLLADSRNILNNDALEQEAAAIENVLEYLEDRREGRA